MNASPVETSELKLIKMTGQWAACVKPVGVDSENQMPELLKQQYGMQAYCVHRLDRTVGGVMVFAGAKEAAARLSADIQQGRLSKEYYAVVSGCPKEPEGKYRDLLWKDSAKQKAYVVKRERKGVKQAALQYRVVETVQENGDTMSLIRVKLLTGRFHQIRVQFASRKMPLAGDQKYGSRISGCTPALWSTCIDFPDPQTGKSIRAEAPPPECFPWKLFCAFHSENSDPDQSGCAKL